MERCGCHTGSTERREKMHSHGSAVGWEHPQTGRQVYLTFSFEYLEDFTHRWEIFQQQLNLDDVPATSPPPCPQVGAIATGVADERDAGNLAPVTPHARENTLEFDKVWRETQELRRELLSSWATAKKLRFQIADSVWTEAHKSRALRTLDRVFKSSEACLTPWEHSLLTKPPSVTKRRFTNDRLLVSQLVKFSKKKDSLVA